MMGRQTGDQSQLFYLFNLEGRIPAGHLLLRINPIVVERTSPEGPPLTRRSKVAVINTSAFCEN
jgi:hypothetical protein